LDLGVQDLIALAIVLAAGGYLGWLALGAILRRPAPGCGSACSRCSAASSAEVAAREQIVTIGSIPGKT
jgi:hypothetical protein